VSNLVPLYREMAEGGEQFHGLSILQHAKSIGRLLKEYDVSTVLDFGCGRGDAYRSPHKLHHEWGLKRIDVALYDPAFSRHDHLPERRFSAVLCSDVLEHIPEENVNDFIGGLFKRAKRLVWASVCCRPAKKTFPQNGENLHVTVQPLEWWQERFKAVSTFFPGITYVLVETP